jgi:hypothetical protein
MVLFYLNEKKEVNYPKDFCNTDMIGRELIYTAGQNRCGFTVR